MPLEAPQDPPSAAGPARSAGRIGRRVGVALFWLLAAYVVGGAALSIIPSLFGTREAAARGGPAEACAREIRELEQTLVQTRLRCAHEGPDREH